MMKYLAFLATLFPAIASAAMVSLQVVIPTVALHVGDIISLEEVDLTAQLISPKLCNAKPITFNTNTALGAGVVSVTPDNQGHLRATALTTGSGAIEISCASNGVTVFSVPFVVVVLP